MRQNSSVKPFNKIMRGIDIVDITRQALANGCDFDSDFSPYLSINNPTMVM